MFDAAFVSPNHISQMPKLRKENPELHVVYITDDVPATLLFNAEYWPECALRVIAALANNGD